MIGKFIFLIVLLILNLFILFTSLILLFCLPDDEVKNYPYDEDWRW
jgi:hypothetical protein